MSAPDLRLGALELADVARRGEHAGHLAVGVAVGGRVVEDGREAAVAMPDLERVVAHSALAEDPLVAGPGPVRLREVLGEVGADELLPAQPVAATVASLTSVIMPSGPMVTSGSRLASMRLRL